MHGGSRRLREVMHDQDEEVVRGRGAQQGEMGWQRGVCWQWVEIDSMERKVKMGTAAGCRRGSK